MSYTTELADCNKHMGKPCPLPGLQQLFVAVQQSAAAEMPQILQLFHAVPQHCHTPCAIARSHAG